MKNTSGHSHTQPYQIYGHTVKIPVLRIEIKFAKSGLSELRYNVPLKTEKITSETLFPRSLW